MIVSQVVRHLTEVDEPKPSIIVPKVVNCILKLLVAQTSFGIKTSRPTIILDFFMNL